MNELFSQELSELPVSDWITRLQDYYLRSDGPYGNTPITSLDVTPSGLAEAIGISGYSDDMVQNAFMSLFTRKSVRINLGQESRIQKNTPESVIVDRGYKVFHQQFHYLILSCLVAATTTNVGDNINQYRERLGALLNDNQGLEQDVSGINSLWLALSKWVDTQISQGKLFRKIILPTDIGNMTVIGYAVKLAYPSKEDRTELKRIIKNFPISVFKNQYEFLDSLSNAVSHRLSERMQSDIDELIKLYRWDDSEKFTTHHIWRLIENILIEINSSDTQAKRTLLWSITASFGGWDGDEIELSLARGNKRDDLQTPYWSGGISQLVKVINPPVAIDQLIKARCIILAESGGGTWVQEDKQMPHDSTVIILSSDNSIISRFTSKIIDGDWHCSQKMSLQQALQITAGKGLIKTNNKYKSDIQIIEGISLGRNKWLSRKAYLPKISIKLHTRFKTTPPIQFQQNEMTISLLQENLNGEFRLEEATNKGSSTTKRIWLLSNSPINHKWATRKSYCVESKEIKFETDSILLHGKRVTGLGNPQNFLCDIIEAIYAKAGAVRLESEIIKTIQKGLPPSEPFKHLAWDILRSFEESGFLEQDINLAWRGRLWRVMPPSIIITGNNTAIIEGAVATKVLDILIIEAKKLNIQVTIDASMPWAVPIIGLHGKNFNQLSKNLSWNCTNATSLAIEKAPVCWPAEKRDTTGYHPKSIWKTQSGFFISSYENDMTKLGLYRYSSEKDRDIFVIKQKKRDFITAERTTAILEFYRLMNQPLFSYCNQRLIRLTKNGYLPLPIAKYLRRFTAKQSGNYFDDNSLPIYQYPIDEERLVWLQSIFGSSIFGLGENKSSSISLSIAKKRHRGIRLHYGI